MPFTLFHPAAVLPAMRGPLVPTALVTGTLAPDLPYYVPSEVGDALTDPGDWYFSAFNAGATHQVGGLFGMFGLNLLTALLLAGAVRLCRGPVAALLPFLPVAGEARRARWSLVWWAPLSALIGIATHLAWDAFADGAVVTPPGFLNVPLVEGMTGFSLLNTLAGAVAVGGWVTVHWRRRRPSPTPVLAPAVRWTVLALAAVAVGVAVLVPAPAGLTVRRLATLSIDAVAVTLLVYAAAWHAAASFSARRLT